MKIKKGGNIIQVCKIKMYTILGVYVIKNKLFC